MNKKQFILFLLIVGAAASAKAQSWTVGTGILRTNPTTTHVGIGDNSPIDKLTIRDGNLALLRTTDADARIISARSSAGSLYLMAGTHNGNKGGYMQLFGNTHASRPNAITFTAPGSSGNAFTFFNVAGSPEVWKPLLVMNKDGNVGIDDLNPSDKLTIMNGNLSLKRTVDAEERSILGRTTQGILNIMSGGPANPGSLIRMHGSSHAISPNYISFTVPGNTGIAYGFYSVNGSTWNHIMRMDKDGKVVIGDVPVAGNYNLYVESGIYTDGKVVIGDVSAVGDYNLYVKNGILTEKVKVAVAGTGHWSDFVFRDDYHLMPLSEVETFIQTNGHLPDIPCAEDVVEEGIDLGVMDAKLLQKIEELTLYVIQLQKEIETIKQNYTK